MRIVTSKQMKQIEQNSIQYQMSYLRLMENAGCAAANFILQTLHDVSDLNCIVFCGKGNNGGDGFVVARKLAEQGAAVTIVLTEGEPKTDDAARMLHIARSMELPVFSFEEQPEAVNEALEQVDVIVDAIYGSGFHGEMDVRRRQITEKSILLSPLYSRWMFPAASTVTPVKRRRMQSTPISPSHSTATKPLTCCLNTSRSSVRSP